MKDIEHKELLSIDCSHYRQMQLCWTRFSSDAQILCSSAFSFQNNEERHSQSELLSRYCEELRIKSSGNYKNLSAVCVCLGPGSFTGTRSSLAFAKGLCAGLTECKLVGASTFEIIQHAYQQLDPLFSVIDARSNSYFSSFHEKDANASPSIKLQNTQDIARFLMQARDTHPRIFLAGPAAQQVHAKLTNDFAALQQNIVLPALPWRHVANVLTDIGMAKTIQEDFCDPHCSPIYMKNAVQEPAQKT